MDADGRVEPQRHREEYVKGRKKGCNRDMLRTLTLTSPRGRGSEAEDEEETEDRGPGTGEELMNSDV